MMTSSFSSLFGITRNLKLKNLKKSQYNENLKMLCVMLFAMMFQEFANFKPSLEYE